MVLYLLLALALLAAILTVYFKYRLPASPSAKFFTNVLVGHRGARAKAFPFAENSLSAAKYAIDHGCQGIEIDIMLSKDGVPIVFHDTNIMSRVCKSIPEFNKEGDEIGIPDLTVKQIKQYQYLKGPDEERIPTCEEFIKQVLEWDENQVLMIELKEYERSAEMAVAVDALFTKYPVLYKQANVASFNPVVLYYVRRINPRIVTNFLFEKTILADWFEYDPEAKNHAKDYPQFMKTLHAAAFHPDASATFKLAYKWLLRSVWLLDWIYYLCILTWIPSFIGCAILGFHNVLAFDETFVTGLQKRGYVTNIWVVNDEEQKKALRKLGNCAITTDILFDK
jgi:glycerophosphoryl diester phosphodiesterase